MPSGPYFPDAEMVLEAWIKLYGFDFTVSSYGLPMNPSEWSENGHILVAGVVGPGDHNRYTGLRRVVIQLESWAFNVVSDGDIDPHPPWWLASHNIESLIRQGNTVAISQQVVGMPPQYFGARILECNALGSPRRRNGDLGGYACYIVEMELVWVPLTIQFTPDVAEAPEPTDLPNLTFDFTDSMVWHVVHDLGEYPLVSLHSLADEEMEAEIDHTSVNDFYVRFNESTSGRVIVGR